MLKTKYFLLIILAIFINTATKAENKSINVVNNFDINKYLGTWYEIARFDNRFERNCDYVNANYKLREDNTIDVINSCTTFEGKLKTSKGVAKFANEDNTIGQLKVSFFWPFYGSYNIILLDPNYNWAVVSGDGDGYLWILARTNSISKTLLESLLSQIQQLGFDTNKFIYASTQEFKPEKIEEVLEQPQETSK